MNQTVGKRNQKMNTASTYTAAISRQPLAAGQGHAVSIASVNLITLPLDILLLVGIIIISLILLG